mmetsp:Transcript_42031/g.69220  ORF Transcript_42031/g.69220 Transcript_42031/m.69220 type:complete len:593 (+) Transcript_42031:67-1845(+)
MATYSNVKLGLTHEVGDMVISKQKLEWKSRTPDTNDIVVSASEIKNLEWLNIDRKKKLMRVTFTDKSKEWLRFIGFANDDEIEIDKVCKQNLGKGLNPKMVNLSGQSWGKFVLRGQDMVCRTENKHIVFTVPYQSLSQSVIQGRNEISLEFKNKNPDAQSSSPQRGSGGGGGGGGDELVEMRIFIPDDDEGAAYQEFHQTLMKKAKLESDKADIIAWFKDILFRVPRGNKEIYFYPQHFLFRTDTFAYRIQYKQIKRLFVFEQPGEKVAFLVHLSPGIRQGNQTYGYLIMEFGEHDICSTKINATTEQLRNEYASKDGKQILDKEMSGPTYDVLSRVFMALSKIKIIAARKFESSDGQKCVSCSFGANQGLLYPLEKSMFFIWKPVSYIRHADIEHVEILRMEQGTVRLFDLQLKLRKKETSIVFTGIDRADYEPLMRYFLAKPNIAIVDKSVHESRLSSSMLSSSRSTRTRKNIRASNANADIQLPGGATALDDEDEDDEDYDMDADKDMLEEDDEADDTHFENIVEHDSELGSGGDDNDNDDENGKMEMSISPPKKKKRKKEKKAAAADKKGSQPEDDHMIDSDEDVDLK